MNEKGQKPALTKSGQAASDDRRRRLAAEFRVNLLKRKAQKRARDGDESDRTSSSTQPAKDPDSPP